VKGIYQKTISKNLKTNMFGGSKRSQLLGKLRRVNNGMREVGEKTPEGPL